MASQFDEVYGYKDPIQAFQVFLNNEVAWRIMGLAISRAQHVGVHVGSLLLTCSYKS